MLNHVSRCEYWFLDRTNSTSNVVVTLSFENGRSCGVTNLNDLAVARWDGTQWRNHGNGGVMGTLAAGTVASAGTVSAFLPSTAFTLASFSMANPLPIELVSFTAEPVGNVVRTEWVTATGSTTNASKWSAASTPLRSNWSVTGRCWHESERTALRTGDRHRSRALAITA